MMDKTMVEVMSEKTCGKMYERLEHLLSFDVERWDCDDSKEIHYIFETMKIIREMKR